MSTIGKRNFRPKFHFTPKSMWINDPNGLVKVGDEYHLFCQHYPEDTVWGPMHWYHAKSKDLVEWEHLPIALYPDELGQIFSGSAVYDEENISGLGEGDKKPLIAMYTSHGEFEQQSIAYSIDGINFKKYKSNPVIANNKLKDFRDPKIFWNPANKNWGMTLSAGDRVYFYDTKDFINWNKTGEFGNEHNYLPGIWECPDMIPFKTKEGFKWVLIGSMTNTAEKGISNTQYFIGDFDGSNFIPNPQFKQAERIDYGFDNYAAVGYNNSSKPIAIGWAMNWEYANKTPTNEYCGQMTFARELSLIETPTAGLRLANKPLGIDEYIGKEKTFTAKETIDDESFFLSIKGQGDGEISLTNDTGQSLRFGITNNELWLDRENAGANDFHKSFSEKEFSFTKIERLFDDEYEIKAYFDVSLIEIYIDNGTRCITATIYPDAPYKNIHAYGNIQISYSSLEVK